MYFKLSEPLDIFVVYPFACKDSKPWDNPFCEKIIWNRRLMLLLQGRQFISQIRDASLVGMNYWERLSHLRVYSQERRRERYQICFLWKHTQGLISGYETKWQWSDRRGRLAVPNRIPHDAPSRVKKARERSLGVHGAHLFNPCLSLHCHLSS